MRISASLSSMTAALTAAALLASPSALLATSQRTFVSTSGVNNASCSLLAPCRSFNAAVAATSAGGEVIVLDSGGYGRTTITHAVTIIAPPGIYAGISVFPEADGVTVDSPGATVVLRGLSINGQGGDNGIFIDHAAKVQIENCVINGLATGIRFFPSSVTILVIADTTLRNNGNGILATALPGGELSRVELWRSVVQANVLVGAWLTDMTRVNLGDTLVAENGAEGLILGSSSLSTTNPSVAIDRAQIVRNGSSGLAVSGSGGVLTVVNISGSVLANNLGNGVLAGTQAFVRLSGNHLSGNLLSGASALGGGVVASMQDNLNSGNGVVSSVATMITPY